MRPLLVAALAANAFAQPSKETLASFEKVWSTVQERYWNPARLESIGWKKIHDDYRAKVERAPDDAAASRLMNEMLGLLGQSHFAVLAGGDDDAIDLMAVPAGDGSTGIDPVVVGESVLVMRVEPNSPALAAGVRPGWEIAKIGSSDIQELAKRVMNGKRALRQRTLLLRALVMARLAGVPGTPVTAVFLDGAGRKVVRAVNRAQPTGRVVRFGHMTQTLEFSARRAAPDIGQVRFNIFLDPPGLMGGIEKAVKSCIGTCKGFVIDVRGNPGGLAILASGIAGFFIDEPDKKLGTLYQPGVTLKLVVNPRVETYAGPLAILVDEASVSTSEILAGGLQDLKRARIFGTRTAGAALPSNVERLPNGDLFQYAVADYISEGGQTLEGRGVTPDQIVEINREALLKGADPVLGAAIKWIRAQTKP
ncbi:MAG: S41 family peptidase [Bryobacteraceae bacterium]|nr:S41 family peptidase [Bryobacteraceae bacterium]